MKSTGLPGNRPGSLPHDISTQQKAPEGLNEKESSKVAKQKGEKLSSADAARLASQAGFQRAKEKKNNKGFDAGDSSSQQFQLPEDDVDAEAWSQEQLESAQGSLSLAASQLGEAGGAEGAGEAGMAAMLIQGGFDPTEEDLAELENLAERKPPHPIPLLEEVSSSVASLFGIELGDDVPVGQKVLAAGLVVAGEQGSIKVEKGKLGERELSGGIEKVTKRGNQAVSEAQRMNKGVNEQLNLQRTFVFKR